MTTRRKDPVFGKQTPLLFAHRGGAREVPESTELGFRYAVEKARADVLEVDVHVLADGQIVVWHGPELDNVLIEGKPSRPAERSAQENDIRQYSWRDLDGRAWVADPKPSRTDLSDVPRELNRTLLLLGRMLELFPEHPVNLEIKESFEERHVRSLVEVLDGHRGVRPILVVSLNRSVLQEFRRQVGERYPTGLATREVLDVTARSVLPFVGAGDLRNRALQTSHAPYLSPRRLVRKVRSAGGAVHVFLTAFRPLAGAIDEKEGEPGEGALFSVLNRGVDGVMTDRPRRVRELIDRWIERQG